MAQQKGRAFKAAAAAAIEGRYVVKAYDRCGEFYSSSEQSFDCALVILQAQIDRLRKRDCVIELINLDEVDLGRADGLSEDEREAVEAVRHLCERADLLRRGIDQKASGPILMQLGERLIEAQREVLRSAKMLMTIDTIGEVVS